MAPLLDVSTRWTEHVVPCGHATAAAAVYCHFKEGSDPAARVQLVETA